LAACAAPAAAPGAAPVEVTRIVEVTREVEVTRIVEATPAPAGAAAPTPAPAPVPSGYGETLKAIKARGKLICGVNSQVPGFGFLWTLPATSAASTLTSARPWPRRSSTT